MTQVPGAGGSVRPHRGVVVLVMGILSLFCCGVIFGPIAYFMGTSDVRAMDAGAMDPSGRGLTQAGRIIGLIGAVLALVLILLNILGVLRFPAVGP
jgi:hypothetical protein